MSMYLEFEPHSWYMGAAIQQITLDVFRKHYITTNQYRAFIEDGNQYRIIEITREKTLEQIKKQIRAYHLKTHNGYGKRYAKRRLNYLRNELRAERLSYGEIAELESLIPYIDAGDVELLEAAGVPEFEEK